MPIKAYSDRFVKAIGTSIFTRLIDYVWDYSR